MPETITRLNAALEGRYRIERQLGEGGMATVYLARDEKHNRNVALKVLKPELAAVVGAERFLAEIETTANLQHPHILPLFDSGEADKFLFYVMPYVEGESLRERLDREHQLPVEEAVKIATNVAEALDYAHRHGVIHRDIKPANILLQAGKPVVSDFGIALAVGIAGGGRLTETGLSLGTPHYMSPEQATGDQAIGVATDIYALGCVLYEMLVGEPPYTGSTAQAILGKIIQAEPVSTTKARRSVPPNVDAAIRKALEKLSADRFTSAQGFASALMDAGFRHAEVVPAGGLPGRGQWTPLAVGLAVLALISTAGFGRILLRPEPAQPVSRQVLSTDGWAAVGGPPFGEYTALAPDGSSMILPLGDQLGLKMRNSTEITPIPGTEGSHNPVYSPDGQWIAYAAATEVFGRPLVGGSPVRLAEGVEPPPNRVGLTWLDDGTILYEQAGSGDLVQIPEDGGEPLRVFELDLPSCWVSGLPSGSGALVVTCDNALRVADPRDLSSEVILDEVVRAWYAPTGHIVYVRTDGALFAVPFDLGSLEVTGSAIPLFEGVRTTTATADMQLGADGTIIYMEGAASELGAGVSALVLVDREGREQPIGIEPQAYFYPRVSPDGGRLATAVADADGNVDLWVLDLARGSRTRVTFGGQNRYFPVWTPAGDRLTISDGATSPNTIYLAAADGNGGTETLLERDGLQYPTSWSRDGGVLAYHENSPETLRDVWVLPAGGDPQPFLVTPFQDHAPTFSPDGRWLAYVSDKSGRNEVYVQPYPGPGPETTVSTAGGTEPVWSPDGSELFYRTEEELMEVAVDLQDGFSADAPRPLFDDPYQRDVAGARGTPNYDIMPDGQRFVMLSLNASVGGTREGSGRLILVQNFFEELERLAPN